MSVPWMPLYVADYLADTGHLSAAEHGAYLMLIMHYWRSGSLPQDERALARISRMTAREWQKSRDVIAAFFDADWRHERIENELRKTAVKSERRAEAGSRGGTAKALKTKDTAVANATILLEQNAAFALASSSQSQSDSNSTMSEVPSDVSEKAKPKKAKSAYTPEFIAFWAAYPTDALMSKKEAFAAWQRLDDADRELAMLGVPSLIEHQRKNPTYRMVHAVRYLSQRRFEGLATAAPQSTVAQVVPQFQTEAEFDAWWAARHASAGAA